jgi:hypothetical protein
MMSSDRRLSPLRGPAAKRAVDSCVRAMESRMVTSKNVRDVKRGVYDEPLSDFDPYLDNGDNMIRSVAADLIAHKGDGSLVVRAIISEEHPTVVCTMLKSLGDAKFKDVGDLTFLLRSDNSMLVEEAFKMFASVERADLLFPLVMSGDDITKERVRRYLHEQGWV